MKKHITDETNGLDYTLVNGVYLPNLISTETHYEIGIWGMKYYDYIKERCPAFFTSLMVLCKMNSHLHEVDIRAKEMYDTLITQLAEKQGVTEQLKAENQILWVQKMTNIANQAREIVYNEVIYARQGYGYPGRVWYGNIAPTEYSRIENNKSYKEALRLVNHNQKRLKEMLTNEQKELLEEFFIVSEEFANLIELDCFKVGFKLGARFTIEAYT